MGNNSSADNGLADLQAVLIGNGLTPGEGRGQGPNFGGQFGASGFKQQFVDRSNQVQHATAGIAIGACYPQAILGVYAQEFLQEGLGPDIYLYNTTFGLGMGLSNTNRSGFASEVAKKLCDKGLCGIK